MKIRTKLIGLLSALTFVVAPEPIARLLTDSDGVVNAVVALFFVVAVFQIADGLQAVGAGLLRGAADLAAEAEYLPPSEVDQGATPVNEDLFDTLPLTGFQSGYWLVRLFIDQDGDVRELQFVESRGSERNADELRFILSRSRFTPARRGEANVKSQKMVEFSFEPGTPTLVSATLPDPSATER